MLKVKAKLPPGCLSVTRFSMPREASLGAICCWAPNSLSYIRTLCVAQLVLTSWVICLRSYCPTKLPVIRTLSSRGDACIVPSIMHHLTGLEYVPDGLHRLSWPGIEPATLGWESRHFDPAANPTCHLLCSLSQKGLRVKPSFENGSPTKIVYILLPPIKKNN